MLSNLGTATVSDAIEMLRAGGVDLVGELSNIGAAYIDISGELEREGFTEIGFDSSELAAAIRAEIALEEPKMVNLRLTEEEFRAAREQWKYHTEQGEDAYQVLRLYRGQAFLRDRAERWLTAYRSAH